jgi:hypothetical protein
MFACSAASYAVAASGLVPLHAVRSRAQLAKVTVLALVFCVTIVLGNVSLRFIPVSFSQAIGATTPAFTALLSLMMLRARESGRTYFALVPIIAGIVIASGAEPRFHAIGFLAAVAATAGRALKSVVQGLLLADASERLDSMSLLLYMAPIAALALVPAVIVFEPGALDAARALGRDGSSERARLRARPPARPPTDLPPQQQQAAAAAQNAAAAAAARKPAASPLSRGCRSPAAPRSVLGVPGAQQPASLLGQPHQLYGHPPHICTHTAGMPVQRSAAPTRPLCLAARSASLRGTARRGAACAARAAPAPTLLRPTRQCAGAGQRQGRRCERRVGRAV